MDLKKYWTKVREVERALPGSGDDPIYLVSLDNELTGSIAGRVTVAASREYAARWIAARNCDLASDEEIERYHADLKLRTASINKFELEKKQTVRLETAIPPEQLQDAIAAAFAEHGGKGKPRAEQKS
jgi:hypothetical protein